MNVLSQLDSIGLEMASSQERLSLESAELVSPPLVRPNPLKVKGIVSASSSRPSSWANHLQPAQQQLGVGPDPHHGQCPPQEGGCYCQLCLLGSHLPPPSLLGSSHPYPRDRQLVNQ